MFGWFLRAILVARWLFVLFSCEIRYLFYNQPPPTLLSQEKTYATFRYKFSCVPGKRRVTFRDARKYLFAK